MFTRIGVTVGPGAHGGRPASVIKRAYVDAVAQSGGLPLLLPALEPDLAVHALTGLDALVLSGGGDVDPAHYGQDPGADVAGVDRRRDRWELALIEAAVDLGLPIFGICRGAQVLNVAFGGTLVQHLPDATAQVHRVDERADEVVHVVEIATGSTLGDITGVSALGANTLHHQAVDELGTGLRAAAWASDGTIEAIEAAGDRPIVGVQWHPELLTGYAVHRTLFGWIVDEGRAFRRASDDLAVA